MAKRICSCVRVAGMSVATWRKDLAGAIGQDGALIGRSFGRQRWRGYRGRRDRRWHGRLDRQRCNAPAPPLRVRRSTKMQRRVLLNWIMAASTEAP